MKGEKGCGEIKQIHSVFIIEPDLDGAVLWSNQLTTKELSKSGSKSLGINSGCVATFLDLSEFQS